MGLIVLEATTNGTHSTEWRGGRGIIRITGVVATSSTMQILWAPDDDLGDLHPIELEANAHDMDDTDTGYVVNFNLPQGIIGCKFTNMTGAALKAEVFPLPEAS